VIGIRISRTRGCRLGEETFYGVYFRDLWRRGCALLNGRIISKTFKIISSNFLKVLTMKK
jgi:hypothetical protein